MLIRRAILATALAASTILGTTACNLVSPVASMNVYAPSDGTQADLNLLKIRNVMLLTDGTNSGLAAAFANSSSKPIEFALGYRDEEGNKNYYTFTVQPYKVLNFGFQGEALLDIPALKVAGSTQWLSVTTNDEDKTVNLNVPILDDSLPQYRELIATLAKTEN